MCLRDDARVCGGGHLCSQHLRWGRVSVWTERECAQSPLDTLGVLMKEAVSSVTKAVVLLSDNKREGNYFHRASDHLAVVPTKLCHCPVFVDEPPFTTK